MPVRRAIVIPPYYEGTSFVDIVSSISIASKKLWFPVRILGSRRALTNRLRPDLLDDRAYLRGQARLLGELMRTGPWDQLLFLDFFQPGLDLVQYAHEQERRGCRSGALLHGGTFLARDLYSWGWLKKFESAWAGIYETIYAPSRYLCSQFPVHDRAKIRLMPFGLDGINFPRRLLAKDIDVIFPHRLSEDKGVGELLAMASRLSQLSFGVTVPQTRAAFLHNPYYRQFTRLRNVHFFVHESPDAHLRTLARGKVVFSCAKQETFGYGVLKAVALGCVPVLPNEQCYPEFFCKKFLYQNQEMAVQMLKQYVAEAEILRRHAGLSNARQQISSFSFVSLLKDFFKK